MPEMYGPSGKPDVISYGTLTADCGTVADFTATTANINVGNVTRVNFNGIAVMASGTIFTEHAAIPATYMYAAYGGTNDGTLTMPDISTVVSGHLLTVKAVSRFVIEPVGTQTVGGAASLSPTAGQSYTFMANDPDWMIMSGYTPS